MWKADCMMKRRVLCSERFWTRFICLARLLSVILFVLISQLKKRWNSLPVKLLQARSSTAFWDECYSVTYVRATDAAAAMNIREGRNRLIAVLSVLMTISRYMTLTLATWKCCMRRQLDRYWWCWWTFSCERFAVWWCFWASWKNV